MHPAISKRLENLKTRGFDLGRDLGIEYDRSLVGGTIETVHLFDYGMLIAPAGQDEAYFDPDGEHLWRFQAGGTAPSGEVVFTPPPTPPDPARLVPTMDVSNYQPRDLTDLIQQYSIEHVIVRLWLPGEKPDQGISLDQIASSRGNGCTVSGYYWCYKAFDPQWSVDKALDLWYRANAGPCPSLWGDYETYGHEGCPDRTWALNSLQEADRLGHRGGVYSSDEMIRQYWGGAVTDVDQYLYWYANYNGNDNIGSSIYWQNVNIGGHQYTGTPVDLSVMEYRATVPA